MVDRRYWEAGFDQLDPSPVDDRVVVAGRDDHRPAEMMRNAQTHTQSWQRHGHVNTRAAGLPRAPLIEVSQ